MPCNIGYKSYAKIEIPEPQPQTFTAKSEAPDINAELLTKLGEEDPEFLSWVQELGTKPLLEEALKRALQKLGATGDIKTRSWSKTTYSKTKKSPSGKLHLGAEFSY